MGDVFMNMLVIGNGFDIALGLPSKYTDFLKFVQTFQDALQQEKFNKPEAFARKCNNARNRKCPTKTDIGIPIDNTTRERMEQNTQSIFSKYEKTFVWEKKDILSDFKNCIAKNLWLQYFFELHETKLFGTGSSGGDNWVDLEADIKNVIIELSRKENFIYEKGLFTDDEIIAKPRNEENFSIADLIKPKDVNGERQRKTVNAGQFNHFKIRLRDDFNKFIMALGIYLEYFIERCSNKEKMPQALKALMENERTRIDRVLSFNYIDNFSRLCKDDWRPFGTCFVHGRAEYMDGIKKCEERNHSDKRIDSLIENNSMIIGFDEYLDDDEKNDDLEFVYYKKYFQRIYKGTGSQYIDWLDEHRNHNVDKPQEKNNDTVKPNSVYIFGHSLDATDKDIFRDIFLREPNDTQVTIFYHNNSAKERIIMNLIQILSLDTMIKKTHGANPDIKFVNQSSQC